MVYCSKCGKKNEDDAELCSKCGNPIKIQADSTTFEKKVDDFAEEMGELGNKIGKKFEQKTKDFSKQADDIGKRVEKTFDKANRGFESWYDRNFGILGPLISSFLGLIVLRFIIEIMTLQADNVPVLGKMSVFLYTYLLVLFGLMLLSSYSSYFHRKYKKQFRWIFPALSAIGLIITLWIISKIFSIIDGELDIPVIASIASFIETYLIMIFVFVLLIGYLVLMFTISIKKNSKQ